VSPDYEMDAWDVFEEMVAAGYEPGQDVVLFRCQSESLGPGLTARPDTDPFAAELLAVIEFSTQQPAEVWYHVGPRGVVFSPADGLATPEFFRASEARLPGNARDMRFWP
jgi:hypothetical protein